MAKNVTPSSPNSRHPRLSYASIALLETQNFEAQRSASHFPWKQNHLRKSRQGQPGGSDWAMVRVEQAGS